jgi:ABC-type dipeptide/oligopeptide/nickel transport system permease component
MMRSLITLVASITLALTITALTLYLSPRDPLDPEGGRGGAWIDRSPLTGSAKWSRIAERVVEFRSKKFNDQPAASLIGQALPTTVRINLWGLPIGWLAGLLLGSALGSYLHRPLGQWLLLVVLAGILVPAPVYVELARVVLVARGPFANRSITPAALTLALLAIPAIAMHQATKVAQSRQRCCVLFARSLRLPITMTWGRLILPGTATLWRTSACLFLVSVCEGPILLEAAFGLRGAGLVALDVFRCSDPAPMVFLVCLSTVLVNIGVVLVDRIVEPSRLERED